MPHANEYPCGCIIHPVAGRIRFCPGTPTRSLSGRVISRDDGAVKTHESAMKAPDHKVKKYLVAAILP